MLLVEAALDRVPQADFKLNPVQVVDFLDAGRRRDVDLGQIVSDHVDTDEDQAFFPQGRPDRGADIPLAGCQRRLAGAAAGMEVCPRLAADGDAADVATSFSIDQYDALVALADLRQV